MSKAEKNDRRDNKPMLRYMEVDFLYRVCDAMEAGALKYSADNYLLGHEDKALLEAMLRHIWAVLSGEDIDEDTTKRLGRPVHHLACAAANINMYFAQLKAGTLIETERRPLDRLEKVRNEKGLK